jgi:catechol 2,3-dioxygenase-like lactoylglutathione lyase family enzyme
MTTRLSRIVLLVRHGTIQSSVNFYHNALGLPIVRVTDEWAELFTSPQSHENHHPSNNNGVVLSLQAVSMGQESQLCIAYTPWMTFTVSDLDTTITACLQQGAHLDGPIQYPAHGKIALLRAPSNDNHMIGLYEPNVGRTVK